MDILLVMPSPALKKNLPLWLGGYFWPPITITIAVSFVLALKQIKHNSRDLVIVNADSDFATRQTLSGFIRRVSGVCKVMICVGYRIPLFEANVYLQHAHGLISIWDIPHELVRCIARVMRGYTYQSRYFI